MSKLSVITGDLKDQVDKYLINMTTQEMSTMLKMFRQEKKRRNKKRSKSKK